MTTIIPGRGRDNAIKVLAAADAAGVDQSLVRTVEGGYAVPDKVAEKYRQASAESAKAEDKKAEEPKAEEPKAEAKSKAKSRKTTKNEPKADEAKATDPDKGD